MTLSQTYKVVIIDDQPAIRKDAALLVQLQNNFIVAGSADSVREALQVIPSVQPDLLLLDINLGDGTGFDILEQLSPFSFQVIFLTAFEEHAIRAIKYGALDYLLKPLQESELQQALVKVARAGPAQAGQSAIAPPHSRKEKTISRLVLSTQEYRHIVALNEIIYCQSHKGYTTFFLTDKRKIMASRHLGEYEDILPPELFIRPHQSYLVNIHFIHKYHRDGILVLLDNTQIPVASRRKEFVLQSLAKIN